MNAEEVFAWLKEKDPYILMDIETLAKKGQNPVILSQEDYDFYLGCMGELKRMQNAIKELLKNA